MKWVLTTEELFLKITKKKSRKKLLNSIYLMHLKLLLCILPQALPDINALKNLNLLTLECTVWNQFATEEGKKKKKSLLFNSSILHFCRPKSYCLFFSRHSPKGSPSKRSRAKYSPFKGKNLWHFGVNLIVHCKSLFAFTARKVLWAPDLRPKDAKNPNFKSSVNISGQLEFLKKKNQNTMFWSTKMCTEQQHQLPC